MTNKKPTLTLSGSLSLVMIFSVLCLTIFAALSLLTSRAELSLTDRWADSVADYYSADSAATAFAASLISEGSAADIIAAARKKGAAVISADDGEHYVEHSFTIDENQALSIRLRVTETRVEITEWRPIHIGDWSPNTGFRLLDPDSSG